MKREQSLRRRLQAQHTLFEAVSALKSLAAHHLRVARAALPAARAYRNGIDAALTAIGLEPLALPPVPPGLVLIASDLGLCDGYNARLVHTAREEHMHLRFGAVYCVGRRAISLLERADLAITRLYQAPTSVAGLTPLLLRLAQEMLGDHVAGRFSSLHVISARFEGVGAFTPVRTQVWPVPPVPQRGTGRQSAYVSRERLLAVALREFLYIVLFQILLDALAAEHGTRLVATGSAADWLEARIADTQRQLAALRREASTQELLDIVSGARRSRQPEGTTESLPQ